MGLDETTSKCGERDKGNTTTPQPPVRSYTGRVGVSHPSILCPVGPLKFKVYLMFIKPPV